VRSATKTGDARKEICAFAEEVDASVIVMGSRGLGALKRMVLGSVSSYVVSHATCPVVIFREKDQ
jgi:nucleotide-binding universal stress UspA family protein